MRPHIYIATHHKTGTTWLKTVFRRTAEAVGFRFEHLNRGVTGWAIREQRDQYFESRRAAIESETDAPIVFFDYRGSPPSLERCKAERGIAGLHMVRDPRDLLLSAVRHHLAGAEKWLDEPEFRDGKTFRQCLADMPTQSERLAFELETHVGAEIRRMASFDDAGVFRTVRYEDLMRDRDMLLFHGLCVGLGLEGLELIAAQRVFWKSSIFGEFGDRVRRGVAGHVRDGSVSQFQHRMTREEIDLVQGRVGEEIERLGYGLV